MNTEDLRYTFAAATPHLFDFAKNAKALLPGFIDPDQNTPVAVSWAKKTPRHKRGTGIYFVFASNLYAQAFLRADHIVGQDLRTVKKPFKHRTDTLFGKFLVFGRFRGVRSTDRINAPLHVLLRTVALVRLHEKSGDMSAEEAAEFYTGCVPRVMALMRGERSWDEYVANTLAFCKLQQHSRWRKVRAAQKVCLQTMSSLEIFPNGKTDGFSNTDELDFEPIKKAERQHVLDMADRGEWENVLAHIKEKSNGDDDRLFSYLGIFVPKHIEAVIIADLEAEGLKSEIGDMVLANFFIQWGYDARGQSGADQVGNDNFKLFGERLNKALTFVRPYLEVENPSLHALKFYLDIKPHIWFDDKAQLDEIVENQRNALYPDNYSLARRKLHFMVEKWGGSHELAWGFATELSDRFPENSALACLPYYALFEEYLSLEMIQDKPDEAWAFLRGEDAKKRLAPYRERIVKNPSKETSHCYGIPIGMYLWARKNDEAWKIAQAVGGAYTRDGFFGTYYSDKDSEWIEAFILSLFRPDH